MLRVATGNPVIRLASAVYNASSSQPGLCRNKASRAGGVQQSYGAWRDPQVCDADKAKQRPNRCNRGRKFVKCPLTRSTPYPGQLTLGREEWI